MSKPSSAAGTKVPADQTRIDAEATLVGHVAGGRTRLDRGISGGSAVQLSRRRDQS